MSVISLHETAYCALLDRRVEMPYMQGNVILKYLKCIRKDKPGLSSQEEGRKSSPASEKRSVATRKHSKTFANMTVCQSVMPATALMNRNLRERKGKWFHRNKSLPKRKSTLCQKLEDPNIAEEKGSTSTERGPHGELRNVRVCLCWW